MSERLFSFRWDIDHRACITDGVPRIAALCRELGVTHSFFVNLGRSTNLREWLSGFARTREKFADADAIHLIRKIGWPRFLLETLLARPVGASFFPELRALRDAGHELGLHGGSDHVVWSRRFAERSGTWLVDELRAALALFTRELGRPAGFASPGFRSDERVLEVIAELGFDYCADATSGAPRRAIAAGRTLPLALVPVTLIGPHTVPWLEYQAARRTPESQVIAELDRHLDEHEITVLYGHPCYEGVRIGMLRRVLTRALERGFRFVTHAELAAKHSAKGST
jgi:peptidoglycan/xylan/chitin deacetylase (PgdA/CDA1 family)